MNTLIKVNFSEPTLVDIDKELLVEEATVLEISDSQSQSQLAVTLLFQEYPAITKSLMLFSGEAHTALGDWTYLQLINRIKLFYESGMRFPDEAPELDELPPPEPETPEAPPEELAPEAETSEPAPDEPAPTEEVVAPTKKRSRS